MKQYALTQRDMEMNDIYSEECISQIFGQRKAINMGKVRWEKVERKETFIKP